MLCSQFSKLGGSIQPKEEEILGMFKWNKNEAVLHSDPKVRHVSFRHQFGLFTLPSADA